MTTLRVCTINIDAYEQCLKLQADSYEQPKSRSVGSLPVALSMGYHIVEQKAANLLLQTEHRAHIYCLQEVGTSQYKRVLIQKLISENFEMIYCQEKRDSIIALDRTRFNRVDIENHSFQSDVENCSVAVAKALDRLTGHSILIASGYVPDSACSEMKRAQELHLTTFKNRAEWSDALFTQELIPLMDDLSGRDTLQIIGAKIHPSCFESLENASFVKLEPNINVHLDTAEQELPALPLRQLSYIFTRTGIQSIWEDIVEMIQRIFYTTFSIEQVHLLDSDPLNEFAPQSNASDHRPVYAEIVCRERLSLIERLLACFGIVS